MNVKLTTGRARTCGPPQEMGEVIAVSREEATRLIAAEQAEPIRNAMKMPPENAAKRTGRA